MQARLPGRISRLGAALIAAALSLTACATAVTPSATPVSPGPSASAAAVATPTPPPEPVTLTFWLAGTIDTVNAMSDLAKDYMALNPNVTIVTTFMGEELVKPALLPALNAGNGPDIWQGGVGPGQPASIIKSGNALDLTPYYYELGWDKIIPPGVVTRTSSDGKLWAIGQSVQTTVMFYNKKIFADRNLSVPTTWDELMAIDATLKKDFKTVEGLPAGDGWPISHNQTAFWGECAGPDKINDILFGNGRWDDPVIIEATKKLVAENKAGLFGPNSLAIGYRDNLGSFFRGEIPMTFTGTFFFPDWLKDVGDKINDFGAFALPNPCGGKIYPTESIAGGWYVNAKTQHPDEAVKFLDFLNFSDAGRAKLLASGVIPVGDVGGDGLAKLPQIHQDILKLNDANRANGSVEAFFDTVMPANVSDVTYAGLQGLLSGKTSPEDFVASIQKAWEEAKAKGDIMLPGGLAKP